MKRNIANTTKFRFILTQGSMKRNIGNTTKFRFILTRGSIKRNIGNTTKFRFILTRGPMKHKFCDYHLLHVLMYVQAILCCELIPKRTK